MWSASLFLVVVVVVEVVRQVSGNSCSSDRLVVYQLRLDTSWGEETFPKQYPQWRPPAQWSRTVGYSHGAEMSLFSIGSIAEPGVKQFVETGDSDLLDKEATNRTFLDTFSAPPISSGMGNTSTRVFVDGNHTKVSLVTKLIPSPDWFVGLDSLELCQDGKFIDNIRLEADPLDAGTDNGFTFTSPNWPSEPQGAVFQITSQYPAHPAGSFHYPHLAKLPPIGHFTLTKEREYQLRSSYRDKKSGRKNKEKYKYQVIDSGSNDIEFDFVSIYDKDGASNDRKLGNKKDKESTNLHIPSHPLNKRKTTDTALYLNGLRDSLKKSSKKNPGNNMLPNPMAFTGSQNTLNKKKLYQNTTTSKSASSIKRRRKGRFLSKKHPRRKKKRKPANCRVTKWGNWGPCSKSCGIGETLRTRTIKKHPKHGGKPCPPLREVKWCGSARNCNSGYFDWVEPEE